MCEGRDFQEFDAHSIENLRPSPLQNQDIPVAQQQNGYDG